MRLPNPKLSKRMRIFLDHAIKNDIFWDVCCDHGYVGIKALESGEYTTVHFVDCIPHIMDRLKKLIEQNSHRVQGPYVLHTKSGADINELIKGTLLIAGVGGTTIKTILSKLLTNQHLLASRILLSPHMDEHIFLNFVECIHFKEKYFLVEKISISEGKRFRPLYIFDRI